LRTKSLYIIISSIFLGYVGELNCQEINLKIKAESILEQQILDSINNGSTFKKTDDLLKFLQETKERLVKKGHFFANFSEVLKKDTLHEVKFELGPRYEYINIYGHTDLFKKNGFEPTVHKNEKYTKVPIEILEKTLESISNLVANENSPFSTIKLINIRYFEKSLEADLKISKGGKRILNEVKILGYKKFPNSFVKRFLEINTNEVFKLNEIHQKMKALNQLSFAKEKRAAELMFKQDSTILYVYLEKNKSSYFDGFLGFGTNDNNGEIEFDGYINLSLVNNLNYGESFSLNYKSDEIDQKTLNVKIKTPYLFGSAIGAAVSLNIFKKDSTFTSTQQAFELYCKFNQNQSLGLEYRLDNSNKVNDNNLIVEDFKSNFYSLKYNFLRLKKNDLLYPLSSALDISLGFGNRKSSNNFRQRRISLKAERLFELSKRNSLNFKIHLEELKSTEYLFNELMRFGGITSIRGFEENSIYAKIMGVICSEYRYRFSNDLFVHTVVDSAYFEDINDSSQKIFGFGFGFGLQTNGGLLRLTYANGKIKDDPFDFSKSKLHVSFTSNF
jgi:hypothetical protein